MLSAELRCCYQTAGSNASFLNHGRIRLGPALSAPVRFLG